MELHYNITEQDYIAFNMNYFKNNALVQRGILMTRIAAVALCLIGGTVLMAWMNALTPLSVAVYIVLAIAAFLGIPKYISRKTIKNVRKILQNAKNKSLCGAKTMTISDTDIRLVGENEDTTYKIDGVHRIATDEAHYYLYVQEVNALIIPFTAFADTAQREAFYARVTACITDEALKC